MIKEGTEQTNEGNWIFYFEELTEKFIVCFEWIQESVNDIIEELERCQEVAQFDYENNSSFSIYFYTEFCVNMENLKEKDEDTLCTLCYKCDSAVEDDETFCLHCGACLS